MEEIGRDKDEAAQVIERRLKVRVRYCSSLSLMELLEIKKKRQKEFTVPPRLECRFKRKGKA